MAYGDSPQTQRLEAYYAERLHTGASGAPNLGPGFRKGAFCCFIVAMLAVGFSDSEPKTATPNGATPSGPQQIHAAELIHNEPGPPIRTPSHESDTTSAAREPKREFRWYDFD